MLTHGGTGKCTVQRENDGGYFQIEKFTRCQGQGDVQRSSVLLELATCTVKYSTIQPQAADKIGTFITSNPLLRGNQFISQFTKPQPIQSTASKMLYHTLRSRLPLLFGSLMPQTRFLRNSNTTISRSTFSTALQTSLLHPVSRSPVSQCTLSVSNQVRGMKTRSSVKRLCEGCKVQIPPTTLHPTRGERPRVTKITC
jgi:hypothetical protein